MSEPERSPEVTVFSQDPGGRITQHHPKPEPEPDDEGPADDLFVCTCRWKLYDMGQLFHSKIEWSDPYCRVHRKP